MKKTALIALALIPAMLFAQGINFEDANWEAVKAKAQKENKMIFVDGFASWCGPCKMMAKDVFTQPMVGDYYNQNFISAKYDMEKEGMELAEKYNITRYPTFAFFSADGQLIHIESGAKEVGEFNNLAENAISKARERWFSMMEAAYEEGSREKEMLYAYAGQLQGFYSDKFSTVFGEYHRLLTEEEQFSKKNWTMLKHATYSYGSAAHTFAVKHQADLSKSVGKEEVETHLMKVEYKHARKEKDWDKFYETAIVLIDRYDAFDYNWLNDAAWTIYENSKDRDRLKKALEWVDKSINQEMNYYNTDTKAHLLFVTAQFAHAKKYAQQAIALAKKNDMEYEITEKLLEKINEKVK